MTKSKPIIKTLVKISCLTAGLAALSSQSAMAQLVDDFESYTAGALETVASPPWNYETTGLASVEADAENQYLTLSGDADWRYFNTATGAGIDSAGSSFSFSIYVEGETGLDHAIGLTSSTERMRTGTPTMAPTSG